MPWRGDAYRSRRREVIDAVTSPIDNRRQWRKNAERISKNLQESRPFGPPESPPSPMERIPLKNPSQESCAI